ncbi:Cytochrome c oxidase assembly protein cox15, partial [Nowakowskiella sp. JEL0078]
ASCNQCNISLKALKFRNFGTSITNASTERSEYKSDNTREDTSEPIARPIVGYWYLYCGALVFGIVVLGGLTRLTESGLSIVEWNLVKGMKPPSSQKEWEEEFDKYKKFPEYQKLNRHMTLPEFKFIFYMEWSHRMLGRFIGMSFIIPGLYFASRGYMNSGIQRKSLLVGSMIGLQGILGWYMVKSGLDPEILEDPLAVPRVSHYWLSAHLGVAFLIYSSMLMTGWQILRSNKNLKSLKALGAALDNAKLKRFRKMAEHTPRLVFLTAISGAFVAGLDAGLIYNEFPKMGNGYIPSDMWALSSSNNENPKPIWMNFLENPSTVQFDHRIFGITTLTVISGIWVYSLKLPLPPVARLASHLIMGAAWGQVGLGISTLLFLVPVPVAAAHQAGSLTLLTASLWLKHVLKRIPK